MDLLGPNSVCWPLVGPEDVKPSATVTFAKAELHWYRYILRWYQHILRCYQHILRWYQHILQRKPVLCSFWLCNLPVLIMH